MIIYRMCCTNGRLDPSKTYVFGLVQGAIIGIAVMLASYF